MCLLKGREKAPPAEEPHTVAGQPQAVGEEAGRVEENSARAALFRVCRQVNLVSLTFSIASAAQFKVIAVWL